MSIHGNDVVLVIRRALKQGVPGFHAQVCPTQSEVRVHQRSDESDGWRVRDGLFEFDCISRDWLRAFRITVEVLPSIDDFEGQYGSDEWEVQELCRNMRRGCVV